MPVFVSFRRLVVKFPRINWPIWNSLGARRRVTVAGKNFQMFVLCPSEPWFHFLFQRQQGSAMA